MGTSHLSFGNLYLGSSWQAYFAMIDCMAKWHNQSRRAPVLSFAHSFIACQQVEYNPNFEDPGEVQ